MFIRLDGSVKTGKLVGLLLTIEILFLWFSLDQLGCCRNSYDKSIADLLRITSENNLPTWFASTQALIVGIVAWSVGVHHKGNSETLQKLAWFAIAFFFFYISMDDGSRFHERVASATARWIESGYDTSTLAHIVESNPSYNWQLLMLPFFVVAGILMVFFMWRQLASKKLFFLFFAGIACFAVAVSMDFVDGLEDGYDLILDNTDYSFKQLEFASRAIEEFIEMVGTSCILIAFIKHWAYQRYQKAT